MWSAQAKLALFHAEAKLRRFVNIDGARNAVLPPSIGFGGAQA